MITAPAPARSPFAPAGGLSPQPRIALVHTGTGPQLTTLADPALAQYQIEQIYLPDLLPGGLDHVDVLVIADRDHPGLLARHAPSFLEVSARGGVIVIYGENGAHTWLPGITWEARPTNFWWWRTREDHGMRLCSPEHPVWQWFTQKAMIWHHHGIFSVPAGAVPLVIVEEDGVDVGATTYLDEVSTPGVLFVTTMDPCFHHGAGFMPGATQLLYQTLRWADATARERIAAGSLQRLTSERVLAEIPA